MSRGQERASQRLVQIIEPTDDEKAAAKATRTFGRSYAHDSTALGVAAFAGFFFIVFAIVIVTLVDGVLRGEFGEQDVTWLAVIGAAVFVVFVALAVVSVLVARHHYQHPVKSDVFAADGRLFHTSFIRDKEERGDDRGIVRINVVDIAECTGFHNRKDRTLIRISPTAMIKDALTKAGIRYEDGSDIRKEISGSDAVRQVFEAFEAILDMRVTTRDEDVIVSPVRDSSGRHFVSGTSDPDLPQDADANGAYCIALKGLLLARKIRASDEDRLPLLNNNDWVEFMQTRVI